MNRIFWILCFFLVFFELSAVYFIMPMPGSQKYDVLHISYFLYMYRWWFRIGICLLLIIAWYSSDFRKKWIPFLGLIPALAIVYVLNYKMSADKMFRQVNNLILKPAAENEVDINRLVIGVSIGNVAKAYPIRMLGYHHFVADTIGGSPVLITYCTVCRTGRVFDPRIDGKVESFRLVGMDHFNAMIEDASTKSWWQQATGEAVAGPLKGRRLSEVFSTQTTLAEWLKYNPQSLIMQPDPDFAEKYDATITYEDGSSRSKLTGTDTISWNDKSWVIGIDIKNHSRAYDWNLLKRQRLLQDTLAGEPVMLVLALDGKSFYAFRGNDVSTLFHLSGDTLYSGTLRYRVNGTPLGNTPALSPTPAYQEFWHSWRTFRSGTGIYRER